MITLKRSQSSNLTRIDRGEKCSKNRCFKEIVQHEMQHDKPRMLILSHLWPRGRRFKSCCPD
nr:MAG TPA: hypothetical protein [Caudoviricetes sp.]